MRNYNRLVRPSRIPSDAVYIEFKFKLLQILDVVIKSLKVTCGRRILNILARKETSPKDKWTFAPRMDRSSAGLESIGIWKCIDILSLLLKSRLLQVSRLHIPGGKIWLPDIIL
jgi:hypothetical protein